MTGRRYDDDRDRTALTRIWREIGWIDDSDGQAAALAAFASCGTMIVADIGGEAEVAVHRSPGTMRQDRADLPLSAITAVTTSRVARKQGLASLLTAEALAGGHADGAALAALGIFEQGFYDRHGFGTGPYEHRLRFDPASLLVDVPERPPVRVSLEHAHEVHALLQRRHRAHGAVVLDAPELVTAEFGFIDSPFGLGFRAADGRLTHVVLGATLGEYGPYRIEWMVAEEPAQLLELLGVVRSLADQVATVEVPEPRALQLQDLLKTPMRQGRAAQHAGRAGPAIGAHAWRQYRILDLAAVVAATPTPGHDLTFGVRVTDPLADRGGPWSGIGGEYTIHLGAESEARAGIGAGVPVLDVSVNALTRLLLGVRPASSLALTDLLVGPDDLLASLDRAIRLPPLDPGWNF